MKKHYRPKEIMQQCGITNYTTFTRARKRLGLQSIKSNDGRCKLYTEQDTLQFIKDYTSEKESKNVTATQIINLENQIEEMRKVVKQIARHVGLIDE